MQKLRHAGVTITEIGDITPGARATQSVIDRYGERYSEHLDRIDACVSRISLEAGPKEGPR
jgi:hypothetical protein